ncbi:hypothetical protein OPV22_033679 [Ensete ventricosum]|uniref:Uncharacterized protein n=1 Tax=Ensete ventricosum TaxID=4639 RepID=A0AAV8PV04_ENSVE|nr:hypothetical protein OPV22_033679 [Ensete ventricosum]
MARRSHLTEIGCIACDELAELGAGERDGGRDDSTIPHSSWPFTHSPSPSPPQPVPSSSAIVEICPSLSPPDNCLPCGDLLAIALGTSAGLILVYSLCRDPISKRGLVQDYISEELCVVLPFLVARISFLVLKVRRVCFGDGFKRPNHECGRIAPFITGRSLQLYYGVITTGKASVMSAYSSLFFFYMGWRGSSATEVINQWPATSRSLQTSSESHKSPFSLSSTFMIKISTKKGVECDGGTTEVKKAERLDAIIEAMGSSHGKQNFYPGHLAVTLTPFLTKSHRGKVSSCMPSCLTKALPLRF